MTCTQPASNHGDGRGCDDEDCPRHGRTSTSRGHVLDLLHAHRDFMHRERHVRAYLTDLARAHGLTDDEINQALELTTTITPNDP